MWTACMIYAIMSHPSHTHRTGTIPGSVNTATGPRRERTLNCVDTNFSNSFGLQATEVLTQLGVFLVQT